MDRPYQVEPDDQHVACECCKIGRMYQIVFTPTDTAMSQSWGDKEEADFICDLLNDAYAEGRKLR